METGSIHKTQEELLRLLDSLIANWENEVVEFKEAGAGYSLQAVGKYFSALSNEANLRGLDRAWLVLGVENKTHRVKECEFGKEPGRLDGPQGLKMQITEGTDPRIALVAIHELQHPDGRVLMLEVPAAPRGMPIAWHGHYYARSGESLVALDLAKLDAIRTQGTRTDWIVLLDRVQKGQKVSAEAIAGLRKAGLIEGRIPHLHISAKVAVEMGKETEYMQKRQRTGEQYRRIFIDFLQKFPGITRKKINDFMLEEIRGDLTEKQKLSKISNLMTVMRRKGEIKNQGTDKNPHWIYID